MSRVERFGNATLYLGDSSEILPTLDKPDALVMDPPYELETSGGGKFRKARPYLDLITEAGLDEGFDLSLLRPWHADSVVCFLSNDQVGKVFSILEQQFHRAALCCWGKTNPMPVANKHYLPDLELYAHAWQPGAHPRGELEAKRRFSLMPVGKSEFDHPTVKPLPLMFKIVANVAGELICDPYMGTGTTGVACLGLERPFIGIEHNPKYFDIACQRVERAWWHASHGMSVTGSCR